MINRNMGCIEMLDDLTGETLTIEINRNMGCIEIYEIDKYLDNPDYD